MPGWSGGHRCSSPPGVRGVATVLQPPRPALQRSSRCSSQRGWLAASSASTSAPLWPAPPASASRRLRDLPVYAESDVYTDLEKLVLSFAEAMTATPAVGDDLTRIREDSSITSPRGRSPNWPPRSPGRTSAHGSTRLWVSARPVCRMERPARCRSVASRSGLPVIPRGRPPFIGEVIVAVQGYL